MSEGNKPPAVPPPLRTSPKATPPPIRTSAIAKTPNAGGRPNRPPPPPKKKKQPVLGHFALTDPITDQCRDADLAAGNKAIVELSPAGAESARYVAGYRFGDVTVLIASDGQCATLRASIENTARLLRNVAGHERLEPIGGGRKLLVAVECSDAPKAVPLAFVEDRIELGGDRTIEIDDIQHYIIARHTPGFKQIDITWPDANGKKTLSLVAPAKAAEEAMVAIQSRQTNKYVSGNAALADLFREYNELRREEYLFVLFADLVLLDRKLREGIGISELVRKLESLGGVEFAENKILSETTIEKVLVLTEGIRLTKQKLEMLASLYPYYWIQQDAVRLAAAYGKSLPGGLMETRRKRLVPRIRQDIRSVQGTILRSMAEIEVGSRQLEGLQAKEEIQKHWSSKAMRWGPSIIQGGLALGFLLSPVPGSQIAGARMLAGSIGVQAAGRLFSFFQQDKEAAALVKRAAEAIFPWWDIFQHALPVVIFEAGQFLDDMQAENMKQEKEIIEKLSPEQKPAAIRQLQRVLREGIRQSHERRASAFVLGGDVRLTDVIHEIRLTTGPDLRRLLQDFSNRLTLGSDKKEQDHDGH